MSTDEPSGDADAQASLLLDAIERDDSTAIRHHVMLLGGPEKALAALQNIVSPKKWRDIEGGATERVAAEPPGE